MKYLLKIAYIGTAYHGFQAQDNAPSVQRVLTAAAGRLFAADCAVTGCSRTDAGVHALEYYITILPSEPHAAVRTENIPRALCSLLPPDIGVLSVEEVPDAFHPRYSAKGKEYKYLIDPRSARDPFSVGRAWLHPMRLTEETLGGMRRAAADLVGRHDFAAFMAAGSSVTDTVRTVSDFHAARAGELLELRVAADGFLYNMVRIMAGTLCAVAEGKLPPDGMPAILASRDRGRAGVTAPPEGLYLNRVFY